MAATYQQSFFQTRDQATRYAATQILGIVSRLLAAPIRSAADVGCGVGTWLSVLKDIGAQTVQGVDGPWVDRGLLVIGPDEFRHHDLDQPLSLGRRFDLAISLEVAEHLPAGAASQFVETLTGLSDVVLFSAAIPYQGGRGHVNEQWPDYWAALFRARGFVPVDAIRRCIWDDPRIPSWYKQNILLYVRETALSDLAPGAGQAAEGQLALVHPETYLKRIEHPWKLVRKALRRRLRQLIGRAD